jgi:anti-sigma factor RsiW
MDCREIEKLLPDHLASVLRGDQARAVSEHLQQCAACREEVELWNDLGSLPEEQPSPMLRRQFESMLEAYQQGRGTQAKAQVAWLSGWLRGFVPTAAAAVLLAIGFLAGLYADRNRSNANELASLHRELTSTRQLVALSMLQQQSASDRLQGVSWSSRIENDPQVKDALLHTLRFDNSVDVRLAALDALRRYTDQAPVRTSIEDSFRNQKSPMVQIALVDFMVEQRDPAAVEKLKVFRQTPDLNPAVRQRVDWGIRQLSRG